MTGKQSFHSLHLFVHIYICMGVTLGIPFSFTWEKWWPKYDIMGRRVWFSISHFQAYYPAASRAVGWGESWFAALFNSSRWSCLLWEQWLTGWARGSHRGRLSLHCHLINSMWQPNPCWTKVRATTVAWCFSGISPRWQAEFLHGYNCGQKTAHCLWASCIWCSLQEHQEYRNSIDKQNISLFS